MIRHPSSVTHPLLRSGFTLLEMAIVMVIIALVAGGVMLGQSLVRQSQVRAMIGEYDQYLKGIKEFQEKYNAMPGDMNNATSIWGTDPVACPNTTYSATAKITTCNGDGNGTIGTSSTAAVLTVSTEWWRAWQHLSNAGFIAGSFSGVQGSGGANEAAVGINVPVSKLSGAGWTLNYYLYPNNGTNTNTGSALWMDVYGHLLNLGAYKSTDYTRNPVLNPDEALGIDIKIDDGKPGTGKVRAWRTGVLANCISGDGVGNQLTATYNTGYTGGRACALVFLLGF